MLTKKEANDLKPRLIESLKFIFRYTDKTIGFTTKKTEAKDVFIWGSIDDEEIEIIATVLVENGQKSKVFSTGVRQITRNHQKMKMGIILAPRLMFTFKHYMENGFKLPFGGIN